MNIHISVRSTLVLIGFFFNALFAISAVAANVTLLKVNITYNVNADGTYTLEKFEDVHINEPQGIKERAQASLMYSESLQTLDVMDAYTLTKDGKRIDVTPDKILTQQLPNSADAPMFSDHKVKMVIFPQVEVGAMVSVHYKLTQVKPPLPGVFSIREAFSRYGDFKQAELTVRAPIGMNLYMDNIGMRGGEVKSASSNMHEWHWILPEAAPIPYEPGAVSMDDVSPNVTVSTLKSYDELAKAYLAGATLASKVTTVIRKQADDITQGIDDKRGQAEAIYRWVSNNIRYVAIFMNVGGYVPHDADTVLQARYGDCKDHSTLLEALLAAKGIKSYPVLVNANNRYVLPSVAALSTFDHAINYLPEYQLFVDSTSGFAQFGIVSDVVSGKTALIASQDNPALKAIPLVDNKNSKVIVTTTVTIGEDGSMTGKNVVHSDGVYDLAQRAMLSTVAKEQLPLLANQLLAISGQNGRGDLQTSELRDLKQPFSYEASFQLPNRVPLSHAGAFTTAAGIGSLFSIANYINSMPLPARQFPSECIGGLRSETTQFSLPASMKITALPKSAHIDLQVWQL